MKNIWRFLKNRMQKCSNKTALVCGERHVSYKKLISEVDAENKILKTIVPVIKDNPIDCVIEILKLLASGDIAVPIHVGYGESYVNRILTEFEEKKHSLPKGNIALIMFTSGSTGKPKGVCLTHKNVISNLRAITKYFKVNCRDSILIARPLMHAAVLVGELFVSLIKGLTIHLYNEEFNPMRINSYIKSKGITTFCATPTVINLMCKTLRSKDNVPLKNIVVSGERLNESTAEFISRTFDSATIYSVYGLTEASPRVSYLKPKLFAKKKGSVGKSINRVKVQVIGDDEAICAPNTTGKLFVKSKGIMAGYLGNKELTYSKIKNGWLDTGDIAYKDKDRYLFVIGRADNMIIRGGMNIYPEEAESILMEDDRIEQCIYSKENYQSDTIVLKVKTKLSKAEIVQLCLAKLPLYMQPNRIEKVAGFQKTISGKTDRSNRAELESMPETKKLLQEKQSCLSGFQENKR